MIKIKLLNMRAFYRYYSFSNILELIMILYVYNLTTSGTLCNGGSNNNNNNNDNGSKYLYEVSYVPSIVLSTQISLPDPHSNTVAI